MLPAELGGRMQASVDLADHLKLELTAVVSSWHLDSFAVQSAYLLIHAKCLGFWSCPEGSFQRLLRRTMPLTRSGAFRCLGDFVGPA